MKTSHIFCLILALCGSAATVNAKVYSLQECRDLALKNNVKTRTAQGEIDKAKQQKNEAFAKYLPQVTATAFGFMATDDLIEGDLKMPNKVKEKAAAALSGTGLAPLLPLIPTSYHYEFLDKGYSFGLTAIQPVFLGGKIIEGNKLASVSTQAEQIKMSSVSNEVLQGVDDNYYRLVTLYAMRSALKEAQKQLASIEQDAQNAFDAGIVPRNDLLKVKLKQNEVNDDLGKVESGMTLAKMALAQYMGLGTDSNSVMVDTTVLTEVLSPSIYRVNHEEAVEALDEMKLLQLNERASSLQTKMSRASLMPSVYVGGSLSYGQVLDEARPNLIGFAAMSIPISALWNDNRSVQRGKISERQAKQQTEDSRQLLVLRMEQSYIALENAYRSVLLAKESQKQAAENLRLNQDYYEAGTCKMSDLLDAQTSDQKARTSYVSAVGDYLTARTSYFIATGRIPQ